MNNTSLTNDTIVEFLLELFERRGPESYLGENVSMADHMEQSAACAVEAGAPDSLVVAALLHDVGHFVSDFPLDALEKGTDNLHEDAGAKLLQNFFPPSVSEPVRLHVAAKRYLCAVEPRYYDRLSDASINSLNLQGGAMSLDEVAAFEKNAFKDDAVKLRYFDDDGKVVNISIKPITEYKAMLESLLLDTVG